jgi:hypothetical protein
MITMYIFSLTSVLALVALMPVSFAEAPPGPNKTPVDPPFDMDGVINDGICHHLPSQTFTLSLWPAGWIPEDCAEYTKNEGYAAADFEAFNVTYGDCSDAWIMCRHKNSTSDPNMMAGV